MRKAVWDKRSSNLRYENRLFQVNQNGSIRMEVDEFFRLCIKPVELRFSIRWEVEKLYRLWCIKPVELKVFCALDTSRLIFALERDKLNRKAFTSL